MTTDAQLDAAVRKLVGQVSHWTPPRWAASSAGIATRAALLHDLIQWMADRSAEAEGRAPIVVPRLDNDLGLPDQLTVVARDLRRFAPADAQTAAVDRINALRGALS